MAIHNSSLSQCFRCHKWVVKGRGFVELNKGNSIGKHKWRVRCSSCVSKGSEVLPYKHYEKPIAKGTPSAHSKLSKQLINTVALEAIKTLFNKHDSLERSKAITLSAKPEYDQSLSELMAKYPELFSDEALELHKAEGNSAIAKRRNILKRVLSHHVLFYKEKKTKCRVAARAEAHQYGKLYVLHKSLK